MPGGSPSEELFIDVVAVAMLASALDTAADDMSAAVDALGSINGQDLGGAELDRAAANFRDRWKDGIRKVASATDGLSIALTETCNSYSAQAEATAAALSTIGSALPDGGDSTGDAAPPPAQFLGVLRGDF
ncbi:MULTISPECIES: hypothetical protein [unclassified Rhodococcus (in: high G+C Gram-positive bacteria)]|uniref:hypothetical protein n=1 Tax=Rhodococcus sp. SJ-3 TaxID=3454628 RepID=UPI002D8685F5|nr:hypothetical protein [Rhodococcus sp. (in: high G+C Gram-positive bacteria)]